MVAYQAARGSLTSLMSLRTMCRNAYSLSELIVAENRLFDYITFDRIEGKSERPRQEAGGRKSRITPGALPF
jgi:hypothetical protein